MNHCEDTTKGAQAIRASVSDQTVIVSVSDAGPPQDVELSAGEYVVLAVFPQQGAAGMVLVQQQGVTLVDPAVIGANPGTQTRTTGFCASPVLPRRFQVQENTRIQVTALTQFGGVPVLVMFERLSPGGGL